MDKGRKLETVVQIILFCWYKNKRNFLELPYSDLHLTLSIFFWSSYMVM